MRKGARASEHGACYVHVFVCCLGLSGGGGDGSLSAWPGHLRDLNSNSVSRTLFCCPCVLGSMGK